MKSGARFLSLFLLMVLSQKGLSQDQGNLVQPRQKSTAAVLDFEGLGITGMEAISLTQRLSGEIVNTDAVILVERSQIEEILEEQGFQQTGCTSAECAVEIGALLGVQKMISGSFGKVGSTYTIEAKVFSVETGETERAVNKTYKGEIDGLITQVELVAWELFDLEPPEALRMEASMPIKNKKTAMTGKGNWLIIAGIVALAGGAYYLLSEEESPATTLTLPPDPPSRQKMMMGGQR